MIKGEKESEKFELKELIERYQLSVLKLDEDHDGYPYYLMTDFGNEFPLTITCYEIADIIREAKVVTPSILEDHEHSCCFYNFKNRRSANAFCVRLAKFLKKRTFTLRFYEEARKKIGG